ncbi:MAG: N-acetyl-gamma-glutamyl-phosphate reductase [Pontixanthobacter sp.]
MTLFVFIDGAEGTTGLEIRDRLADRPEFVLQTLPDDVRKDDAARRDALNACDIAILCLPDDAARDAVAMIDPEGETRIIDASSAHRVTPDWTYGFPELVGQETVAGAMRVSNPGCYPTGFIALIAPLIRAGLLPAEWPYTVHAVSGYSGGGKSLIDRFERGEPDLAFRAYGFDLAHKHGPEMKHHAGLCHGVVFSPSVGRAYRGMIVEVPLHLGAIDRNLKPEQLRMTLTEFYRESPVVKVAAAPDPAEMLLTDGVEPDDGMTLHVFANTGGYHARLVARFDNLGKGASGAAVQNLNLMAGLPEHTGLNLPDYRASAA